MTRILAILFILIIYSPALGAELSWQSAALSSQYQIIEDSTAKTITLAPDGVTWVKFAGNPILPLGAAGKHDDAGMAFPGVMYEDGLYKVIYSGWSGSIYEGFGVATSPNWLTWTRLNSGDPVVTRGTAGQFDDSSMQRSHYIKRNGIYQLWYGGYDGTTNYKIGYMWSTNLINWTKAANNPVMTVGAGGTWNDVYVFQPWVIYDEEQSIYKMWFAGYDGSTAIKIGYATSPDGWSTWVAHPTPVMSVGAGGTWDVTHVEAPTVWKENDIYKMVYLGVGPAASYIYKYGLAWSPDGWSTWIKSPLNPLIAPGAGGTWDDAGLDIPCFIAENNIYRLLYTGNNGSTNFVGLATNLQFTTSANAIGLPIDGGASQTWNMASITNSEGTWYSTGLIQYRYAAYSTIGSPSWSTPWKSLDQLRAESNPSGRYFSLWAQLSTWGTQATSLGWMSVNYITAGAFNPYYYNQLFRRHTR